ncbi:hypothetical protein BI347_08035 [Chromobacterium sphagni]|uniref:Polynucleotide kinase n=3 Tax=Chromobacteriaceae TaxID=1499392 RepID=A0A1S1X296_9NEIS|nr:hypothetical protein BI347_02620 [Chromobacterium sphagni]OHX13468.1 hypothetical protein BI347_08035 [Chromobacterium sphagni]
MNKMTKWIGVDLDGTLAQVSHGNFGMIGRPVEAMMNRVKAWLNEGDYEVRIFTARAADPNQIGKVKDWLSRNGLAGLEVTHLKDRDMIELWDDKAVRVERNTGKVCEGCGNAERDQPGFSHRKRTLSDIPQHTDC